MTQLPSSKELLSMQGNEVAELSAHRVRRATSVTSPGGTFKDNDSVPSSKELLGSSLSSFCICKGSKFLSMAPQNAFNHECCYQS